jgi:hypothetical protein
MWAQFQSENLKKHYFGKLGTDVKIRQLILKNKGVRIWTGLKLIRIE